MSFEEIPSDEKLAERLKDNSKMHIATRFKFLLEIKGLRPDGIHGLLATTSAGKSTLTRSIIADTTECRDVLLILSEENAITYFTGFKKQGETIRRDKITVLLEKTIDNFSKNFEEKFNFLFERIISSGCQFVFWDNLTASRIFGDSMNISMKGVYFQSVIDFLKENKIGFFYVIHTDKSISKNQQNIFSGNNARGSDAVRNTTEYYFVMQGWKIKDKLHNFITTEKHREHDIEIGYHLLVYKNKTYSGDKASTLEEKTLASKFTQSLVNTIKASF